MDEKGGWGEVPGLGSNGGCKEKKDKKVKRTEPEAGARNDFQDVKQRNKKLYHQTVSVRIVEEKQID